MSITRLDIERAEAEKLQQRTDYMLNAALKQVKLYKERMEAEREQLLSANESSTQWQIDERARLTQRLEKCEADLQAARNRIDDDTETINRQCKKLGRYEKRLEQCEAALMQVPKLVYAVILFAGRLMPKLPHEGSCTPESGCDASCMEAAAITDTLRMAYAIDAAALAALEGK